MKVFSYRLAGEPVRVHYVTTWRDAEAFLAWVQWQGRPFVAVDTESTGLNVYSADYRLRLVQFGNRSEAWVLPADRFHTIIAEALERCERLVLHNAPYDLQVFDQTGLARLEDLFPKTYDTRILAHLHDPRGREEGGVGLGLKDLSAIYVDATAPDTSEGLTEVFRREYKATKATGWAVIDLDHPTYVLYAGLDVILTARLFEVLGPIVRERGLGTLSQFEHQVQAVTTRMMRRGMLLDVEYTRDLRDRLEREAEEHAVAVARYGVDNVNSTRQVADALLGMGEDLVDKTPSGAWKVDKEVLLRLADLDRGLERIGAREPNPVAEHVFHAKRAAKWAVSYAQAMLDLRDPLDRVHPSISSLQARTARMSISAPPLQQLPSGDWTVRRCLIADPGHIIGGVDYQAVEMRVLAAIAGVTKMREAILAGEDLHAFTARLIEGENFTAGHRKLYKGVGFGKVYGGGAVTLARQTGAPLEAVKRAIAAYDKTYPEIRRYARRLQERAQFGAREVVTPSGRRLPLDRDRLYAATNYVVQSTARDLLAQAALELDEAGLGEYLLLPVHDEFIFQAPPVEVAEVAHEIARVMGMDDFFGVPIEADPDVYGESWGHGYACKAKDGVCRVPGDHPHRAGVRHVELEAA